MGIRLPLNHVIEGFLLILVLLVVFAGCSKTSGIIKPNCDLTAREKYDDFVKLFEECGEDASKCGTFDYTSLLDEHEIIIKSSGSFTDIDLECDGNRGGSKIVKVGLCVSEGGNYLSSLERFTIDNSVLSTFSENGEIELKKIREGEVCIARVGESIFPSRIENA